MSGAPKPRIFLDSNTILDVIERRKNESIVLLDYIKENKCFCCTSAFAHIELIDIEQEFTHITNMLGKRKTLDTIIRERRKKILTLEQREDAIYRVKKFFDQYKIETWELDRDGWSITLEIMRDLNIKAPDSIHIATALVAGRFRKKRRDAKGYQVKESESQRTLQGDDMGREGPHSLSEEVVLKIREGVEAHRNLKRDGEKDD